MRASEGNPHVGCSAGRRASVPRGPGLGSGSGSGSPPGAGAGTVAEQGMGQTPMGLPACTGVATGYLHRAGNIHQSCENRVRGEGCASAPGGNLGLGFVVHGAYATEARWLY